MQKSADLVKVKLRAIVIGNAPKVLCCPLSLILSLLNQDNTYRDKALFLNIAEGDEKAFTQLFHTYTPKLFPFVIKLTRNEQMAQEMIQETFLRLWVNRAGLASVNDPGSWIFRIAANVSITWLRKHTNRARLLNGLEPSPVSKSNPVADNLETKELSLIINQAVEALPERRKEIYRLSRDYGLNHQEIADKLQLSKSTVANQIGISLKFIREYINKQTGLSMLTLLIFFPN